MNQAFATEASASAAEAQQKCQQECTRLLTKLWNHYRGFVARNQGMLELSEDAISRLLFWIPHSATTAAEEGDSNNTGGGIYTGEVWREMIYGLLSLQRLAMELALGSNDISSPSSSSSSYGMTVQTRHAPKIAATSVRILLTIVQSIMPTLLAMSQHGGPNNNLQQRKAKFRLAVEQVKFALRMYLLLNYWKQQKQEGGNTLQTDDDDNDDATLGILVDGGMFRAYRPAECGLSWDQAHTLKKRQNYVGNRTGMKLGGNYSHGTGRNNHGSRTNTKKYTMSAELLNATRPLLWAWFESKYHPSSSLPSSSPQQQQSRRFLDWSTWPDSSQKLLKAWLVCFGMDLVSIRLLQSAQGTGTQSSSSPSHYCNPATDQEIRNRKMRMFLYALRSPIWSEATAPLLDGFSRRVLQRIPLMGSLMETFLWDWILYYQHPFVSEEQ